MCCFHLRGRSERQRVVEVAYSSELLIPKLNGLIRQAAFPTTARRISDLTATVCDFWQVAGGRQQQSDRSDVPVSSSLTAQRDVSSPSLLWRSHNLLLLLLPFCSYCGLKNYNLKGNNKFLSEYPGSGPAYSPSKKEVTKRPSQILSLSLRSFIPSCSSYLPLSLYKSKYIYMCVYSSKIYKISDVSYNNSTHRDLQLDT